MTMARSNSGSGAGPALILLAMLPAGCGDGAAPVPLLEGVADVATHADGRRPIGELYADYLGLLEQGWALDVIVESRPAGTEVALPIVALRSPQAGQAVWLLSGIHGEETAGPNAIAAAMADIAELGARHPVVLMPLLNPQGYARNWRYLNVPVYSETVDGQSVGDSSHLLPVEPGSTESRAPRASSPEAAAITAYVLRMAASYPPRYSIDLHEDDLIDEGYVYSQGIEGPADPLALLAVDILKSNGIPLKLDGQTRFGEPIEGGIIGPVTDSSIDELMSAGTVLVGGRSMPGPAAGTVLVFETPAAAIAFEQRVAAHLALIRRLAGSMATGP